MDKVIRKILIHSKQSYYVRMTMVKVIKIQDENYRQLLEILHELELERNERLSFDKAISLLIKEYQERAKKSLK